MYMNVRLSTMIYKRKKTKPKGTSIDEVQEWTIARNNTRIQSVDHKLPLDKNIVTNLYTLVKLNLTGYLSVQCRMYL
jgi:hypothetical protein